MRENLDGGLFWWLRNNVRGKREWRLRIVVLAFWVVFWVFVFYPNVWFLLGMAALQVVDLLVSYHWWRRDQRKAEPSETGVPDERVE